MFMEADSFKKAIHSNRNPEFQNPTVYVQVYTPMCVYGKA